MIKTAPIPDDLVGSLASRDLLDASGAATALLGRDHTLTLHPDDV